jgi:hypothetical protein
MTSTVSYIARDRQGSCGFGEGLEVSVTLACEKAELREVQFERVSVDGTTLYTPYGYNYRQFTANEWSILYDFVERCVERDWVLEIEAIALEKEGE